MRSDTLNAQMDDDCRGVDLVVLLDQSRSMENNDPEELRIDAAQLIVNSLGNNILYDCINEVHRLAVIGFGDQPNGAIDTELFLEDVRISPTLKQFSEWQEERKKYKDMMPKPGGFLGGTDFLSAFKKAKSVLDQWTLAPIGNESRLRGIVMIADGGPCVIDRGCFAGGPGMNWRGYLDEIRNYLDPNGTNLPFRGVNNPDSVKIWFVGFNDTITSNGYDYLSANGPYGTALRDFWQQVADQHGGSFVVLDSTENETRNRDINKQVALIVDDITGSELIPTICKEPFFIDPYLDRTIVRILKIGSDPGVELDSVKVALVYQGPKTASEFVDGNSDGNAGQVVDYISDGPNEHYVIERPAAGTWKIRVENADECRDLDVRYQVFPLVGELELPEPSFAQYDEPPYYDAAIPQFLKLKVFAGASKSIVMSDPDFPLSVIGTISQPDGSAQTLRFRQNDAGEWQSEDPLELPFAGTYTWQVEAESPNGSKKDTIRHFTRYGTFKVRSVRRFSVELVEPGDNEAIPLNQFAQNRLVLEPIRVLVRIYDAVNDEILSAEQIAQSEGSGLLTAQIVTVAGTSESVPMAYDPGAQGWIVTLTPGKQGVPISTEVHQVVVQLNDDAYNHESYRPAATNGRQATAKITRSMVLAGGVIAPTPITRVAQEEAEPYYDSESPIFFAYRLTGYDLTDGRLRDGLPPDRLDVKAEISLGSSVVQSLGLAYNFARGVWLADKPLLVKDDGQYSWKVTVSVISDEDKVIVSPFSDNGTFTVTKVGRFHVEVRKPVDGKVYPLNRIANGQPQDIELPVNVVIVDDETGANLTDVHLRAGVDTTHVVSVTVRANGQSSPIIALKYDSGSQTWVGALASGLGQTPDETGMQTLEVVVDHDAFDRSRYRPSVTKPDQDQVTFKRVLIRPIELEPKVTQLSSALYSGTRFCLNAQPVPLQVDLAVVTKGGALSLVLDPSQIASDGTELAIAELVQGQTVLETGKIEVVQDGIDKVLRVTIGVEHTGAGQYQIRITPKSDALMPEYEYLRPTDVLFISVERTTDWRYAPETCGVAKATGVGLLSLALLWIIFCFVRRPVGLLEIYDDRGNPMAEFSLGRGVFLRPRQTIKWRSDPSISKIVVTRGSGENVTSGIYEQTTTGSDARAVEVRVYDDSGSDLGSWTLGSGQQPTRVTMDSQFKYT